MVKRWYGTIKARTLFCYPNMVFLPSTVAPAGRSPEGLPLGLQAVAAEGEDKTSIEFCRLVAAEIVGFTPPPGYC